MVKLGPQIQTFLGVREEMKTEVAVRQLEVVSIVAAEGFVSHQRCGFRFVKNMALTEMSWIYGLRLARGSVVCIL